MSNFALITRPVLAAVAAMPGTEAVVASVLGLVASVAGIGRTIVVPYVPAVRIILPAFWITPFESLVTPVADAIPPNVWSTVVLLGTNGLEAAAVAPLSVIAGVVTASDTVAPAALR